MMATLDSSSSWTSFCLPRGRGQPCAAWAGCTCSPEPSDTPIRSQVHFFRLFSLAHTRSSWEMVKITDASLQLLRAQLAAGSPWGRRRASKLHVPRLGHVGLGKCLGFETWVKRSRAQQNGLASRGPCEGRGGAVGGKPGWDFASK